MDLQENLKVGNSLRTLKHIQMESQASKQGEAGVFCELLIWGRGAAENEGCISYISNHKQAQVATVPSWKPEQNKLN